MDQHRKKIDEANKQMAAELRIKMSKMPTEAELKQMAIDAEKQRVPIQDNTQYLFNRSIAG